MYTTNINSEKKIQVNVGDYEPITIPQMFHDTVKNNKDNICISWKSKSQTDCSYNNLSKNANDGYWINMTYSQTEKEIYKLAGACNYFGLKPKDVAIIMGFNSPQWFLAFHGVIQAGGVVAGCYSTNKENSCLYLAEDSKAKIAFVENWAHGIKFMKALNNPNSNLEKIVVWSGDIPEQDNVLSFCSFMRLCPEYSENTIKSIEKSLLPNSCCNLIYTSGTTGNPKGVMLSHDNMTWDVRKFIKNINDRNGYDMGSEQVLISYLPLSHIAAQMLDFMVACMTGGSIYFATNDALKGGLLPLLQDIRPTFFFGVPRVWEKIMDSMKAKGSTNSFFKNKILDVSKYVGLSRNNKLADTSGRNSGFVSKLGLYWICNKLVYSKIKTLLGFDRCELFGSGAAPISESVLSYFWSLDIPIVEGFGMSETTGISTMCLFPEKVKLGTVGFSIGDSMIKISDQNEILLKGRHIMMGYLNNEEKTKETFTNDGYLKTGDMGTLELSSDNKTNFLKITGRIKELLITAGGENVAPVPIEDQIKYSCPLISNVMLIGDTKKFLSLLVTLRLEINQDTLAPTNKLDSYSMIILKKIGIDSDEINVVKGHLEVTKMIQTSIDKYNETAISNAQKIQKFVVLDTDFSVHGGELTESQKLKRKVVLEKYKLTINEIYNC